MLEPRGLVLASLLVGSGLLTACTRSYTVPVPAGAADRVNDRDAVQAFSTSDAPESEVALRRDDKPLDEGTFEKDYLERVKDDDLARLAREKRRRAQGRTLLYGAGSLVLGGGALALLAVTQPELCEPHGPSCGKALLGVGVLALVAGVGAYTIGCLALEGPECGVIGHPPLERREAETFVKRYNETAHAAPAQNPTP